MAERASNGQRALWTFLMCALVGPLLAGLLGLVVAAIGGPAAALLPNATAASGGPAAIGLAAVSTLLWYAMPAALAGAALAAVVTLRGMLGVLEPAIAGAVALTLAAVMLGGMTQAAVMPAAFASALVMVACRGLLVRAGILDA